MKILGTLNINGNQEPFQLNLTDTMAMQVLTLYNEAQSTILREVDEECKSKVFDRWLLGKDSSLYRFLMSEFMSELHIRMQESLAFDDDNSDIDDYYWWPENQNTIEIESFSSFR